MLSRACCCALQSPSTGVVTTRRLLWRVRQACAKRNGRPTSVTNDTIRHNTSCISRAPPAAAPPKSRAAIAFKTVTEKDYYFVSAPPVHRFCYIFSLSDWATGDALGAACLAILEGGKQQTETIGRDKRPPSKRAQCLTIRALWPR